MNLTRKLVSPFIRKGRHFADSDDGAVAIEFGILALPFFSLIFAILETSLVFFAGQVLDSALQDASRKIRTGQAQAVSAGQPAWDMDDFRREVCEGLYGMFDCTPGANSRLRLTVEVLGSFSEARITAALDENCLLGGEPEESEDAGEENEDPCSWMIDDSFSPGGSSQIVIVRAYYKWPTIVNLPGFNLATQVGGNRLLTAARVLRNEPF